jgi:hypothetical protein
MRSELPGRWYAAKRAAKPSGSGLYGVHGGGVAPRPYLPLRPKAHQQLIVGKYSMMKELCGN